MKKFIVPALFVTGLGLSACASDKQTAAPVTTVAPVATAAPATAAPSPAAGSSVVVKAGSSAFGQILVDDGGNTLYAFTNDTEAKSTCSGTCAEAWPPVIVDPSTWTVAPGLDAGVFSTVTRDDGTEQLTAGRFPLYRFSGDARPGDVNGQSSGGVWFVVDTKASPIIGDGGATAGSGAEPAAAPALIAAATTGLGDVLTGNGGLTVYGFTMDADGQPTCNDACAGAWPPVIVDATFDVSTLPTPELFTVVDRADGTKQLKAGKWPLYYFSGDAAPGDTNGQGSGGSWFAVAPDGSLIK